MENTWENNYKLAVLRAAGVDTLERLAGIDLSKVEILSDGSEAYDSGCDTCGGFDGYISVTVYWYEGGNQQRKGWNGNEEVAGLIRSFGEM